MKIKLSSTSFLLPNNKSWEFLEKNQNINFGEYGDFIKDLNYKSKSKVDILILFLPDLIDYISTNQFEEKSEFKKILNIIQLIEKRLKNNDNSLIISLSEFLFYKTWIFGVFIKNTWKIL